MRAVIRHVDHSIGLDPHADRDMEDLACTTFECGWKVSGQDFGELQDAAMKHSGEKQHFGFRQVTTNYWRVVRHDQDVAEQLRVSPSPGVVTR
ncbi:hypothetical protein [Streptomyces sp. NPDC058252]|uniref:DUF7848 domain-containing protein n=1 Tax=Streptomyces sp. NPDC058252 TaxID=3346405 RepID=UPI0036EAAF82